MLRKSWAVRLVTIAVLAVAGASVMPAQASTSTTGQWTLQTPPFYTNTSATLYDVAATSPTDAWAVGYSFSNTSSTLAEHWNGSSWSIVPSPNQGTGENELFATTAVSSSDVWAVGHYWNGSTYQTLTENWNGSAWSIVPSPNVSSDESDLDGVAAISSSDVWAVGAYQSQAFHTLIEHWNGTSWSIIPSPNQGTNWNRLISVSAVSSSDVWAVGEYQDGTPSALYRTLIEHWNGSVWSIVPSPNQGTDQNILNAVAAISSSDVWAAGYYVNGGTYQALTEHWNGSTWSVVASPNPGSTENVFHGITAGSSSDVWAVGYYANTSTMVQPLTEHWNGSTWAVVPSPAAATNLIHDLFGAAQAGGHVLAVGRYSQSRPLALHWHPSTAGPTPTIGSAGTDGTGHRYVTVTFQDPAGILNVAGTQAINCTLAVTGANSASFGPHDITPAGTVAGSYTFSSPYPSSVDVKVARADNTKGCTATINASDSTFNTTFFDPVLTPMSVGPGAPMYQTEQINQAEHWVTIQNLTPGLSQITFVVNGTVFLVQGLHDGEQRTLDVSKALRAGTNTVQMVYLGRVGASAAILFSS